MLDPNGRAHNVQRLNPGSPRQDNNQTTYDQPDPSSQQNNNTVNQFSRPPQSDTLVLSDTMLNDQFYDALQSSTQPLSLSLTGDMQNNQSGSMASHYTPTAPNELLSEELFQDLAGLEGLEEIADQLMTDLSHHSEINSYSFDDGSANSGYTPFDFGGQSVNINSSMVTGRANDFDKTRPCRLTLTNGVVFSDQAVVAVRKTDFAPQTPDSAPAQYTQFSDHKDLMLPPLVVPELAFPNSVNVQPTEESKQKPGSIDEDLSLIKMMNRKVKPKTGAGLVVPNNSVPASQLFPKLSPQTPFPVQVSSPAAVDKATSPRTPQTPITPSTSTKGPFSIRCFGDKGLRCFELGIREDLSRSDQMMGLKAVFYCFEMATKFRECMSNPCDLKVANNISAKLCDFDLDSVGNKLVSKVPRDCKLLLHTCVLLCIVR